ncbi:hypothetical protein [Acidaminococcus fermentans]|uniref:hypothetical protein n=1 Tax=Acidaminococcus fermentans TaxID=905 RepID=UPI00265DF9D3|nr:hypothetical protein [Acidaminococcus fermentans]
MAQILLTLFLFCVSLLPAAYLRYYPFRSIVRPSTRHFLLCGHLYIFLFEFVLLAGLFGRGLMKFEPGTFQFLYYFCYLPYLLLLVFTVRPFWLRHLFVLGLQAIYMILIHTLCLEIFKLFLPEAWHTNRVLPYFSLYLGLFLLGMPLALKVLGKLFTREQLTSPRPAFWTWLGPIPLLLCYYHANQGYFILDPEILFHPFFQLYILITLGMLVSVALLLVRSLQGGLRQAQTMLQVKEQNLRLQGQLNVLNDYAAALRKEQQELAILRHDSRHQLRLLGELAENGQFGEAEKHLLKLRKEVADK